MQRRSLLTCVLLVLWILAGASHLTAEPAAKQAPSEPGGADVGHGPLSQPPRIFAAEGFSAQGVRALFYEGLPYRGKATRVLPGSASRRLTPVRSAGDGPRPRRRRHGLRQLGPPVELARLCGDRHGYLRLRARRHLRQVGTPRRRRPARLGRLRPDRRAPRGPVDLSRRRRGDPGHSLLGAQRRSIRPDRSDRHLVGRLLDLIIAGVDHRFKLAGAGLRLRLHQRHGFAKSVPDLGPSEGRAGCAGGTRRRIWQAPMPMLWVTGATISPTRWTPFRNPIACRRARARFASACACLTATAGRRGPEGDPRLRRQHPEGRRAAGEDHRPGPRRPAGLGHLREPAADPPRRAERDPGPGPLAESQVEIAGDPGTTNPPGRVIGTLPRARRSITSTSSTTATAWSARSTKS